MISFVLSWLINYYLKILNLVNTLLIIIELSFEQKGNSSLTFTYEMQPHHVIIFHDHFLLEWSGPSFSYYGCGASVASVAAVHNLNIKERYKNLRFCHGLLASLSADYNALLCGRASFSADHNALRCEEPRLAFSRPECTVHLPTTTT